MRVGLPFSEADLVRLDETSDGKRLDMRDGTLRLELPAHALRSVLLRETS